MPLSLESIRTFNPHVLRIEHIHYALIYEVRDVSNWDNALTLFTDYIAPIILASQKAASQKIASSDTKNNAPTGAKNNAQRTYAKPISSQFRQFAEDSSGNVTHQLSPDDVLLVQRSIGALVRYAPTPEESNVIYLFYLQCDPPVRSDETIDNCLISLIYKYAQVKDNPELRAKGLDLIKIALDRGIGLPSYNARQTSKNRDRQRRFGERFQNEGILVSVSTPILNQLQLQIAKDGRTLEERTERSMHPSYSFGAQQRRQQYLQQQQRKPVVRHEQDQEQEQEQRPVVTNQTQNDQDSSGRAGSPQQSKDHSSLQQPAHPPRPQHHHYNPKSMTKRSFAPPTATFAKGSSSYSVEEEVDQYTYYTQKSSRASFSGADHTSSSSSGGRYSARQTIAFVPASTNALLTKDDQATLCTPEESQGAADDLAEKVADMQLNPQLQSLKSGGLSDGSFEQTNFQQNGQPQVGTDPGSGVNYLLEQRKLVEGVYLKPLPDHLITTYRPGYLDPSASVSSEQQEQDKQDNIDLDPTIKYLTFLPHSGFHNQRSELENALLLARLLNRTLIMPKVYLGPPMPWFTFPKLHERLLYRTKIGLGHCRAILESQVEEELEPDLESKSKDNKRGTIKEDHHQPEQQPQSQSSTRPQLQPQSELQESQQRPQQQPEYRPSQHQHQHQHQYQHQHHHHHHQRPLYVEEKPLQIGNHQDDETMDEETEFTTTTPAEEDAPRAYSFRKKITSSDIPLDDLYQPREEDDEGDAKNDLSDKEVGQQWREEEDEQDEEGDDDMREDMTPSWFEEPEGDDPDQFKIATGNSFGDMMDLEGDDIDDDLDDEPDEDQGQDVQDWETVEENEGDEGDDEVEEVRVGIVDDDDDEDIDWPESFALPAHQRTRHRSRSRMSSEFEDSQESLSIYNPPEVDFRETHQQMWKRSLPEERGKADQEADATPDSAPSSRSLHEHQMTDQDALQRQAQQPSPPEKRRGKWNPLPAECLQYESWTMTDWDLFFDLNTLRRYVRVVTRESMSIAYLHDRFNLEYPREEEPPKSNSITAEKEADTVSSMDSESGSKSVSTETNPEDDSKNNGDGTDSGDGDEEENGKKKTLSLRTAGDILFFEDTSRYDYRFTENPEEAESQRNRPRFGQEFTIEWLAQRPERLIHLGSIFGSGRISIDSLESRAWHQMIRDHLIIRTEILQTISQLIADRIRGNAEEVEGTGSGSRTGIPSHGQSLMDPMEAGFVGVHVRMSDGHFSLSARETIESIRQELMWQMDISDEDNDSPRRERLSIEQCRVRALNHHRMIQEELQKQQQLHEPKPLDVPPLSQSHEQQHAFSSTPPKEPLRRSNGRYTPIYLATDARRPRENAIFDRLFETFNCIFTLDDFSDELTPLYEFRNPEDGTLMAKFLIPMVDAMVVAKAGAFFGTPASTFSNYIRKQLRPAYTDLYD
ncbi:hypothetical protein BGZ50_007214 [Haplosporangium sp. Z 11]|nr:hypothetical protein BGZ50_007214 [Haplosporangium sp. Z 11]